MELSANGNGPELEGERECEECCKIRPGYVDETSKFYCLDCWDVFNIAEEVLHTCTLTYAGMCLHILLHTHVHAHMHAHARSCTHAHAHRHRHARTHAHTCIPTHA